MRNKAKLEGDLWDERLSSSSGQNSHLVSKATRLWESILARKGTHTEVSVSTICCSNVTKWMTCFLKRVCVNWVIDTVGLYSHILWHVATCSKYQCCAWSENICLSVVHWNYLINLLTGFVPYVPGWPVTSDLNKITSGSCCILVHSDVNIILYKPPGWNKQELIWCEPVRFGWNNSIWYLLMSLRLG